jgi:hypothetical protein
LCLRDEAAATDYKNGEHHEGERIDGQPGH